VAHGVLWATGMRKIFSLTLLSALLLGCVVAAADNHRDGRRPRGGDHTALLFRDGASAHAPGVATTANANVTLEAWLRWDGGSGAQAVVYNGNSATSGYGIFVVDGNVRILAGGVDWATCATCSLAPGEWTHLAVVRTTNTWFMFQNGWPQELDKPSLSPHPPSGLFSLASSPAGGELFTGALDEVRVWNMARSARDIAYDFAHRLAGDEPGLAHYYRFDDGHGSMLTDASGGLPVVLVGSPIWIRSGAPLGPCR